MRGVVWYLAENDRACFGFAMKADRVVECAPIGRRWLMGRDKTEARAELLRRGYRVVVAP